MPPLLYSVFLTPQQATVDPCLCQRFLDTHRQVWFSLWLGHCSFLLGPGVHKVLFVPPKSLFPQSCGSSVIKPHWPPKSDSMWILSPLLDLQVGKSVVSARAFLTVPEFLWYNYSKVYGSSSWWLYGGANGNLLQKSLCHMPCDPGLLQPEPLSPWQATADLYLCRRHSNTQRQVWLRLCEVSGSYCVQGVFLSPLVSLAGMGFDSKSDFAPPTIFLVFFLCPWMSGIFIWWDPTFSC